MVVGNASRNYGVQGDPPVVVNQHDVVVVLVLATLAPALKRLLIVNVELDDVVEESIGEDVGDVAVPKELLHLFETEDTCQSRGTHTQCIYPCPAQTLCLYRRDSPHVTVRSVRSTLATIITASPSKLREFLSHPAALPSKKPLILVLARSC